ncbi:MAG: hypothetical protein Q8O31_01115, partial [Rhodocyclaceae bacterium]|nr:hypothetical protein [Rhodocyclaceae bacterium]
MNDKDIVSKDILKQILMDIARLLLRLDVDQAEFLETEHQCVEDRRADLVARMTGKAGPFILHIEIQNDNDSGMAWRMLRYRHDIGRAYPNEEVRQILIYIGRASLSMPESLHQT